MYWCLFHRAISFPFAQHAVARSVWKGRSQTGGVQWDAFLVGSVLNERSNVRHPRPIPKTTTMSSGRSKNLPSRRCCDRRTVRLTPHQLTRTFERSISLITPLRRPFRPMPRVHPPVVGLIVGLYVVIPVRAMGQSRIRTKTQSETDGIIQQPVPNENDSLSQGGEPRCCRCLSGE